MIRRTYKQDGTVVETEIPDRPRPLRQVRPDRLLAAMVASEVITEQEAEAVLTELRG